MFDGSENRAKQTEACNFGNHHRCNYVMAAFTHGDEVRTTLCACWCHTLTAEDIAGIKREIFEELRDRAQVELTLSRQ